MKNFNELRMSFEQYYIRKGYGTAKDLDFYCLTEVEEKQHPERNGFNSYVSKEVNELFTFFMAGTRSCNKN